MQLPKLRAKHFVKAVAGAACLSMVGQVSAVPISFGVDGTANIFGAGHLAPVAPGGGGAGVLPFEHMFAAGPGQVLRMLTVTGLVDCVVRSATIGPDGAPCVSVNTNILPFGGISGIKSTGRQMYLVGVFTDDTEPADPAPSTLDYPDAASYSAGSYSPLLNQVFFIGDGLTGTGSGALQDFIVPAAASKLYLGFADAFDFGNDFAREPGFYGDNVGSLDGRFEISQRGVPLPGTLVLLGIGVIGLALRKLW